MQNVQLNFNVCEKDINGKILNGLSIETPMAMVLVTKGFDEPDFKRLMACLVSEFNYNEKEMIPLRVSNSQYDFLLITQEVIDTRPLGVTWSDIEGGKDGHELDVSETISNFMSNATDDELWNDTSTDHEIWMIYDSNIYGSTEFDDELDVRIDFLETGFDLTNVQIMHRGIYFTFVTIDEPRVPFSSMHPEEN